MPFPGDASPASPLLLTVNTAPKEGAAKASEQSTAPQTAMTSLIGLMDASLPPNRTLRGNLSSRPVAAQPGTSRVRPGFSTIVAGVESSVAGLDQSSQTFPPPRSAPPWPMRSPRPRRASGSRSSPPWQATERPRPRRRRSPCSRRPTAPRPPSTASTAPSSAPGADHPNGTAALASGWLRARSAELAGELGGGATELHASAVRAQAEGRVLEAEDLYDAARPAERYFEAAQLRSGSLLSLACLPGRGRVRRRAGGSGRLAAAALNLGVAAKIQRDVTGFVSRFVAGARGTSASPGGALSNGVYSLPVIRAVEAEPKIASALGGPVEGEGLIDLVNRIRDAGGLSRAAEDSREHAEAARAALEGLDRAASASPRSRPKRPRPPRGRRRDERPRAERCARQGGRRGRGRRRRRRPVGQRRRGEARRGGPRRPARRPERLPAGEALRGRPHERLRRIPSAPRAR